MLTRKALSAIIYKVADEQRQNRTLKTEQQPRKKRMCGSSISSEMYDLKVKIISLNKIEPIGSSINFIGEFDPGSGRTLAACLTHASRTENHFGDS